MIRKVFFVCIGIMIGTFFTPESIFADNLVFGINSALDGWTRRYPQTSNEIAVEDEDRPGYYLIQLHLDSSEPPAPDEPRQTVYAAQSRIPVNPGKRYHISTRCRTEIINGSAGVVCFFLKDGVALEDGRVALPGPTDKNDWTDISGIVEAPMEADAMILQLALTGTDGTAWFDEVTMTEEVTAFSDYRVPVGPFLFSTPEQWANVRQKVKQFKWAEDIKEAILKIAAPWAEKTQKELTSLIPPAHAYYIYGLSKPLDPVTGEPLRWSGWKYPFSVENAAGVRYPNTQYPDDGTGYTDVRNQLHYFTAYANGDRINAIEQSILPALCNAWALTREEKYARAALCLLDAIATIYPTADSGPLDYPGAKPGVPGVGRLQRPYYQAARALMRYAYCYDMLSDFSEMDASSPSSSNLTIRQNILTNLIGNGGTYCYAKSQADTNLNNGTLDYNRGVLIAGALLGIPSYLEHAAYGTNGIVAAISNAIDSQGRYFETSSSYSGHTTDLMVTTAHMLMGVNRGLSEKIPLLFDDDRFAAFCLEHFSKIQVEGRLPAYGDAGPDRILATEDKWFDPTTYRNVLMFSAFSDNPAIKQKVAVLLHYLKDDNFLKENARKLANYTGNAEWRLLLEEDSNLQNLTENDAKALEPDSLFGDAGIALLRSGKGAKERVTFLRLGPTRNHGQLDEMGLQFYAFGREFSADPGYFNTHLRFGFTRTTVAHNTVVVERRNQLQKTSQGGTLLSWTPGKGFSSMEADNPSCYAELGVSRYQRRIAQIDMDGVYYMVDLFRVQGGKHYDYSFHAILGGKIESFEDSGLTMISNHRGSVFSEPINYSEDLMPDGRIRSFPEKPFYWAVPGQGYGFLGEPATYEPGKQVRLDWVAQDATGHRLTWHHFPPNQGQVTLAKVHTTNIPPLDLEYALSSVTAKPEELVRFLSVIRPQEVFDNRLWTIKEILPEKPASGEDTVGVEIGVTDKSGEPIAHHIFVAMAEGEKEVVFQNGLRVQAREGFVSLAADGVPKQLIVSDGSMSFGGLRLQTLSPLESKILEIRNHPLRICVEGKVEDWKQNSAIQIKGEGYAKPLVYRIEKSELEKNNRTWLTLNADSNLQSSFYLNGGVSDILYTTSQFPRVQTITDDYDRKSGLPSQEDRDINYSNGFNGFMLATKNETILAKIRTLEGNRSNLRVDWNKSLDQRPNIGEKLTILAPVAGDQVKLLAWAQAVRNSDNKWTVTGTGIFTQ